MHTYIIESSDYVVINTRIEDILKSNKIGFRVYVYDLDKEITIIEEQDEYNIDIHKDDEIIVIKEDEEYSIVLNDGD